MGGVFGKKGGSKQTTDKKEENTNWLMKNTSYTNLANQGIVEGSKMTIPGYSSAEYSDQFYNSLNAMQNGLDLSDYDTYQNFYNQTGQSMLGQGQSQLAGATDVFSRLQNLSGEQMQDMFNQEYNSDFVKSRVEQAASNYRDVRNQSIQSLNQSATASGNMGSSRSGIAEGVIRSKEAQDIANATVDIQSQEEQQAEARLMNRLGIQTGAAGQMANIGQTNLSTGLNLYGQGYNVYQGYNQAQLSNWNNSMYAGQTLQQIQQQELERQRENALIAQSPSLARLGYMNQFLGPMANYQTYGTSTTTTTTPAQKNGFAGQIMGAVGTGVGAYFGGPVGAQIGGSVGSAVGSQF
ncbi:hypothetical protein DLL80_23870 [Salmonella enterica subsp. enterica serovar Newport]|uniref:Uncharacterized protein n=1 Tax=Salmonella newport TaxID=108619 RepID=A0A5V6RMG0_SALNE|nr:hypothetical protein [Salmonella enterica subsp. enterica serovar Newport]